MLRNIGEHMDVTYSLKDCCHIDLWEFAANKDLQLTSLSHHRESNHLWTKQRKHIQLQLIDKLFYEIKKYNIIVCVI